MTDAGIACAVLAWAALIVVAFSLCRIAAVSDRRIASTMRSGPLAPVAQPGAAPPPAAPGPGDNTRQEATT